MMFRRMCVAGAKSFARSGVVSFATVLIMTVTLSIITGLIFLSGLLSFTLSTIEHKVDVSVYFVTSAAEPDILALQSQIEKLPEVASVTYTSRDQALADFRQRHATDQLTLQALDELGGNPLGASLSITAKDPSQYESIVNFLGSGSALSQGSASIIDRINYDQNKAVIDRITAAIGAAEKAGMIVVLLFALASVIIAFATIRLAIYTARDEISVMRLVGASNAYIRGPFIVEGVISGAIAALITLLIFYPATWYAAGATASWLGGFDFFAYYRTYFALIFVVILGSGVVLGALASFLAVRRYLRI
ncbi:MAG: ABC transporter permease [Patescibacteria group bacterium]|nr:ABC transporter permease [Patescibacteria group bacterium]